MKCGYVYLASNPESGTHKIGYSFDPARRLDGLRTSAPKCTMVYTRQAASGFEKFLHRVYAKVRIAREWFSLSQQDIEYISSGKAYRDFLHGPLPEFYTTTRTQERQRWHKHCLKGISVTRSKVRGVQRFLLTVRLPGKKIRKFFRSEHAATEYAKNLNPLLGEIDAVADAYRRGLTVSSLLHFYREHNGEGNGKILASGATVGGLSA